MADSPTRPPAFVAFMVACKGYSAWTTARALSGLTPGFDWRGCSKSMMADDYARSCDRPQSNYPRLKGVDLKKLRERCEDISPLKHK